MDAVRSHLIRREPRIVVLLDPPFDRSAQDPGYIKSLINNTRRRRQSDRLIRLLREQTKQVGKGQFRVAVIHAPRPWIVSRRLSSNLSHLRKIRVVISFQRAHVGVDRGSATRPPAAARREGMDRPAGLDHPAVEAAKDREFFPAFQKLQSLRLQAMNAKKNAVSAATAKNLADPHKLAPPIHAYGIERLITPHGPNRERGR